MDPAPKSPAYKEASYWRAGLDIPTLKREVLPKSVDVVVIGAGYTGVSAAIALARSGASVLVLEKHGVGFGASTRNGGIVHPGLKLGIGDLTRRYGYFGRELYDATVDAFRMVETLIDEHSIECDYRRSGHLLLAHHPRRTPGLKASALAYRHELHEDAHFIPRDELSSEIGTEAYHGGLCVGLSGSIHPGKYFLGLLKLALEHGVSFREETPVLEIRSVSERESMVLTPHGTVRAEHVLVATNGYTDSSVPALQSRVIPIGSYIIVTEPVSETVASSVSPRGRSFFDTRNFLNYWRVLPDRRVLFGGRASFAPTTVAKSRDILYRRMVGIHPQLNGTAVDYAWDGRVGFTFDRLPHAGRIGNVTYALGYCGTGVALSTYLGARCASWMLGNGDPPVFASLSFPRPPFYRGNPWFLRPAGLAYSLRDRLGR